MVVVFILVIFILIVFILVVALSLAHVQKVPGQDEGQVRGVVFIAVKKRNLQKTKSGSSLSMDPNFSFLFSV